MKDQEYQALLRQENVPALGCTEPMAVAYVSALAVETLGVECETLTLQVSANVLKNALGVGIPGSTLVGAQIAAALAWVAGKSRYGLEVLRDVTPKDELQARRLLDAERVHVCLAETERILYIRAIAQGCGSSATAAVSDRHTNVTELTRNGVLLPVQGRMAVKPVSEQDALTLAGIWNYIHRVPARELEFLQEGIDMNRRIAEEGLKKPYGLQVGRRLYARWQQMNHADPALYAAALAAAASDARMAGCQMPVMTVTGSGNQGAATILPVVALAECIQTSREQTLRAVALCQLVAIHAKQYMGRLSALCGAANAAAIGTACAAVYLLGGNLDTACNAVQNVVGDVAGLICDGAKSGCALKIATGVQAAMLSAMLALEGSAVGGRDGIVAENAEDTLKNLGCLGREGMQKADQIILQTMLDKV